MVKSPDSHFVKSRHTELAIVIRPSGTTSNTKLPVLVWIYGGGLYAGSTADPQYNVSGIAHIGQEIGKPVIVGMNFPLPHSNVEHGLNFPSFHKLQTWSMGLLADSSDSCRRQL